MIKQLAVESNEFWDTVEFLDSRKYIICFEIIWFDFYLKMINICPSAMSEFWSITSRLTLNQNKRKLAGIILNKLLIVLFFLFNMDLPNNVFNISTQRGKLGRVEAICKNESGIACSHVDLFSRRSYMYTQNSWFELNIF